MGVIDILITYADNSQQKKLREHSEKLNHDSQKYFFKF